MPAFSQGAGQYDVPIEDSAGRVRDRVLLIVTFRQDGIEGSNRTATLGTVARPLHELR